MDGPHGSLADAMDAAIASALEGIHQCLPGQIESYDPKTRKASVKPLIKKVYIDTSVNPMAVIDAVPVVWPGGGGGEIRFPLNPGDGCLLVFSERNLENFLALGGDSLPADGRKFDMTDCICIPGLKSFSAPATVSDNKNFYLTFGGSTIKLAPGGLIAIGAQGQELLDLFNQLLQALLNSTTETLMGPQPLSSTIGGAGSVIGIIQSKLQQIKGSL